MKTRQILAAVLLLIVPASLFAGSRITRTINDGWTFTKEGVTEIVHIPHTWNAIDTQDEQKGFYRGLCTYRKQVWITEDLTDKDVYVRFEGANQVTEVIVNGKMAGKHIGGYTAFCFDITEYVKTGANDFLVKVDNSHNVEIPPLSADFTFYGGIYRDIELILTPKTHISLTHYASSGVYLRTPKVDAAGSEVTFETHLTSSQPGKYILQQTVTGPDNCQVATVSQKVKLVCGDDQVINQKLTIAPAKIWDVESPNLYRVVTTIKDAKGNELDKVENPLGFRTYSVDAEKGSILNGRKVTLTGTNRHQDYCLMGNALTDEMHVRDIKMLKEMGSNFLRISHYPQDPIVEQLCDRFGIAASIEIPFVNEITPNCPAFHENSLNMLREMIHQYFNHPSIVIWCYANEYQHHTPFNRRKTPKDVQLESMFKYTGQLIKELNDECHRLDPSRPTMNVICSDPYDVYKWNGAADTPDILGVNLYSGWYGGTFSGFPEMIKKLRNLFPGKPVMLTEYGCGVDPRVHSKKPMRFDYSSEYGRMFHSAYLEMFKEMPFLCATAVWNFNDFYAEPRIDAVPHVNNKGLVGLDRVKKNGYYLYQAHLSKEAYIKIGDRDWLIRGGVEGQKNHIEVFSNAPCVVLFVNGQKVGVEKTKDCVAQFDVTLVPGENHISVEADGGLKDAITVEYREIPSDLNKFTEMNVMLGSYRYFEDRKAGAIWIPEQEYKPGSWGYVGGGLFSLGEKVTWNPVYYSSLDILGTENDPVFQTQRVDINAFKADLPDGKYYVYLYFAELAINPDGSALLYNVGGSDTAIQETEREFDVAINGSTVLKNFNIREQEGASRAVIKKFTVDITSGEGLSVDFTPIKGKPVLNAVRIYRCN